MQFGHICGTDGRSAPIDLLARLLEQVVGGSCCIGAVEYGYMNCTCWEPVYDTTQASLVANADVVLERTQMCDDCAFRPDSPERSGDKRYKHSDDDDDLRTLDHFWCHQGMRKPVAWRHPSGITIECDTDAYDPPMRMINDERVPFKADGTPADRCAGFAAFKRAERIKA